MFIVHGHDELNLLRTKSILSEHFGLKPIVLGQMASGGRTLIQKFEEEAAPAEFAFVLLTPDDLIKKGDAEYAQARPNVIFELGWFYGRLGRERVCILCQNDTKIHSDLDGILRIQFETSVEEKLGEIKKELERAGLLNELSASPGRISRRRDSSAEVSLHPMQEHILSILYEDDSVSLEYLADRAGAGEPDTHYHLGELTRKGFFLPSVDSDEEGVGSITQKGRDYVFKRKTGTLPRSDERHQQPIDRRAIAAAENAALEFLREAKGARSLEHIAAGTGLPVVSVMRACLRLVDSGMLEQRQLKGKTWFLHAGLGLRWP